MPQTGATVAPEAITAVRSGCPSKIGVVVAEADGFDIEDGFLFDVPTLPRGYRPLVTALESSRKALSLAVAVLSLAVAVLSLIEYLSSHRGILSYHGWLWGVSSPRRTENLPQIPKIS